MKKTHSRRSFIVAGVGTAAWMAAKPALGQSEDLAGLSLKKASDLVRSKAASPVDLTEACLKRIEKYNPALNAFITVTRDRAMAAAREMESEIHSGCSAKDDRECRQRGASANGQPRHPFGGAEAYAYHSQWITESPEKYQPGTRTQLQRSAEAKAWEYAQARREVDLLRRQIKTTFSKVDLLIAPTMKTPPALLTAQGGGAGGGNNNVAFDVFGLPSISVPCGFTSSGLPIGLQISGAHFAESTVLALAHAYEQATEWHKRKPGLST